jgi:hypothetical protein
MTGGVQPRARRWAVSFADLALLIACTLMLGWRPDAGAATTVPEDRAVLLSVPVADLFEPGEAMLAADAHQRLAPARAALARGQRLAISVGSGGRGSARLDAWELAAARTAVLARTLGGDRLDLSAPAGDATVRIGIVR